MDHRTSNKDQILRQIRENPFLSQQEQADKLGISRSAVASHIAQLIRDQRLVGRAYVLPDAEPILVIGGANLDRVAKSLAPVAIGTSNPVNLQESFGGVARNVAENLVRMGLPVRLITAVGGDLQGEGLLKHARDLGIDTGGSLVVPGSPTGTYTALLEPDGAMVLGMADMAVTDCLSPEALANRRRHWGATQLRVADLNLPAPTLSALIEDCRQQDVTLVLVAVSEPKMMRLPQRLEGVSLLILNRGEIITRIGRDLPGVTEIMTACQELQTQGVLQIVVTLGEGGVILAGKHDSPRHIPALPARIVDVTGAGDAFSAGVVASLSRHPEDLHRACLLGQRLAVMTLGSLASVCPELTPALLQ